MEIIKEALKRLLLLLAGFILRLVLVERKLIKVIKALVISKNMIKKLGNVLFLLWWLLEVTGSL